MARQRFDPERGEFTPVESDEEHEERVAIEHQLEKIAQDERERQEREARQVGAYL